MHSVSCTASEAWVRDLTESRWSDNRLLATRPAKERERLLPQLEILTLSRKETLYARGEEITYVYFPLEAVIVLVSSVGPEATVEVGLIGNEGMVGTPILMGAKTANSQALVLLEGKAQRLSAEVLKRELRRSSTLRDELLRYAHALSAQSTQLAACHRHHPPQARMARWLLMARDRSQNDELQVTQDFIAHLLGTRRATVTEAANILQKKDLIQSHRGRIKIYDRAGLEAEACSCYQVITKLYPAPPQKNSVGHHATT